MSTAFRRALLKTALLSAISAVFAISAHSATFPTKEWERANRPESAGFSSRKLSSLTAFLESLDTTAMMVVSHGKVVFEYGDLKKVSYIASCRKSVLAMMYGNYVASGKIQLNRTLRDLDMDDLGGLLPREREATIEDIITARSGVFHAASNPGDFTQSAPLRGSQKRGTYQL